MQILFDIIIQKLFYSVMQNYSKSLKLFYSIMQNYSKSLKLFYSVMQNYSKSCKTDTNITSRL